MTTGSLRKRLDARHRLLDAAQRWEVWAREADERAGEACSDIGRSLGPSMRRTAQIFRELAGEL